MSIRGHGCGSYSIGRYIFEESFRLAIWNNRIKCDATTTTMMIQVSNCRILDISYILFRNITRRQRQGACQESPREELEIRQSGGFGTDSNALLFSFLPSRFPIIISNYSLPVFESRCSVSPKLGVAKFMTRL